RERRRRRALPLPRPHRELVRAADDPGAAAPRPAPARRDARGARAAARRRAVVRRRADGADPGALLRRADGAGVRPAHAPVAPELAARRRRRARGRAPSRRGAAGMKLRTRFAALPPVARAAAALLLVFAAGLVWNGDGAFFQQRTHLDLVGSKGVIGLLAIGQ